VSHSHIPPSASTAIAAAASPEHEVRTPALLSVVDMVWPEQSNHHGTLFGGAALSILDRVAFIAASKVLRGTVVTASVGSMNFAAPAPAGHVVECNAVLNYRGRRSATLHLQLLSENLLTGARTDCLSGEFVMVSKESTPQVTKQQVEEEIEAHRHSPTQSFARATVAEIVFPGHANHRGILHGGPAMEWMAKAGFVAATRQVRRTLVMASSGHMDFVSPAFVGDVVEVVATVQHVGHRSVHVETQMWAESPTTGERRHCTIGKLVFVVLADQKAESSPNP
jgi:acyl-CoA hydrolase